MGMPLEAVSFPTPNFPEFPNPFGNKLLAYFPTGTPLHFQLRKGNRNRNRHWITSWTKWVCKAYYVSLLAQPGHLPPVCLKLNADSDTFAHCRLPRPILVFVLILNTPESRVEKLHPRPRKPKTRKLENPKPKPRTEWTLAKWCVKFNTVARFRPAPSIYFQDQGLLV